MNCSKRQQHWGLGAMEWIDPVCRFDVAYPGIGFVLAGKYDYSPLLPPPTEHGLMKDIVLP